MIDMGFEEDVRTIFSYFKVCSLKISHDYKLINVQFTNVSNVQFSLSAKDKPCYLAQLCPRKSRTLRKVL